MDLNELIEKINESVDSNDLVSTRKYIEKNINLLTENKHLLRSNARELVDFVSDSLINGIQSLNREEINIIYSINNYASKFDMRGLKISVKNNADLLNRDGVNNYLNEDAKALLESMNIQHKSI